MVRVYADPLIAVDVTKAEERGAPLTIVVAEDEKQEIEIRFYGEIANKVSETLIPGARFTFRGIIIENKIVGRTYALVA